MGIFNKKENAITLKLTQVLEKQVEVFEEIGERAFPIKGKKEDDEKKLAAYALNLCLVSISQIIDYNDLIVLEQEYDTILNNLNLENMPKDESLLNILRQILDTVSFFRIQEGDKKIIELEYQHKMKNAIWSAVPSVSVLLGTSDPVARALTLATQIGTGYMNYRRTKSENDLNKNKQMWELQRSAMEQFNGLRRELFTTAWRLVDEYGIKEELRLTEKQITEYNNALMIANPYKRYAVLVKMQEKYFQAYPQIYFEIAHTALELAGLDEVEKDKYIDNARHYFDKYFKFFKTTGASEKDKNLLREDSVYASAAFEYSQIYNGTEKIDYLSRAVENGNSNYDIIQMCAMAYLESKKIESACELFEKLVLAGYNVDVNTNILGMLYVRMYLNNAGDDEEAQRKRLNWKNKFDDLSKYTNINDLIKFPTTEMISEDEIENEFLCQKRLSLVRLYGSFINAFYISKYKAYNQINEEKLQKEGSLVKFLIEMQGELSEIEEVTGLAFGDLSKGDLKDKFKKWKDGDDKLPDFSSIFETLFNEAFKTHDIENKSLDEISLIESCIINLLKKYSETHNDNIEKEYTLSNFFDDEEDLTKTFKDIKGKFSDAIKSGINEINSKEFELLVHGTKKYKDYIADHKLDAKEIVAVLDGKKGKNDLLFTTNGINVRVSSWQKIGARIGAGSLGWIFGPWGIVAATSTCEFLISVLSDTIKYKDIEFADKKIKKPDYSCDKNLIPVLKKLVDELKEIGISNSLTSIKENLSDSAERIIKRHKAIPSLKKGAEDVIEKLSNQKFSKTRNEKHRLELIDCAKCYLHDKDVDLFVSKLRTINNDIPTTAIKDLIEPILKLI